MKNKIGLGWRNIPRKVINERFDRIRTSYPYHIKEQYNPNEITMDNEWFGGRTDVSIWRDSPDPFHRKFRTKRCRRKNHSMGHNGLTCSHSCLRPSDQYH